MKNYVISKPSAWLPLAMSFLALIIVAVQLLTNGVSREADEGAAAHLWQLLMVGQVPIIGWFIFSSAAKSARQSAAVLALQVTAALVAVAPVLVLGL